MSDELSKKLRRIENKIDSINKLLRDLTKSERSSDFLTLKARRETPRDIDTKQDEAVNIQFLRLPDSLRQTMFAMDNLKEASAFDVAKVTNRSRSVESFHLNQLERMGYLVKSRRGKRIYFSMPKTTPDKDKKFSGIFL